MADPYGVNPIAEMLAERNPSRYEQLLRVSEPPKMFANGASDVPAFTASGIDPQALLKLPVGVRHAAAENPDITQVYRWFEQYGGIPEAEVDSDGLRDAKLRAEAWMRDTDTRTPEEIEADRLQDEADYEAFTRANNRYGMLPEEIAAAYRLPVQERNQLFTQAQAEKQKQDDRVFSQRNHRELVEAQAAEDRRREALRSDPWYAQ